MSEEATGEKDEFGALPGRIAEAVEAQKARLGEHQRALKALTPLAKLGSFADQRKLEKAVQEMKAGLAGGLAQKVGLDELVERIDRFVAEAPARLRTMTGRELKSRADARGIALQVLERGHPVVLRLPPFGIVIDFQKGKGEISFARQKLADVPADAGAIFDAYDALLKTFDTPFDAEEFFEACRRAYTMALADQGKGFGDRIEIEEFVPLLALTIQPKSFRIEPTARNLRSYSRAQFAYDVWRLRQAEKLTHKGLRLNLGVATGNSTAAKNRVIFFEDPDGNGEYKVSVFFTEAG